MELQNLALQLEEKIKQIPLPEIHLHQEEIIRSRQKDILHLIQSETVGLAQDTQDRLMDEFSGLGPLRYLINDDSITEIIINSFDEIWVERKGLLEKVHDHFISDWTYEKFVDLLCAETGIVLNVENPQGDGRWGNFRIHITGKEISDNQISIALRRISSSPWSLEKLLANNWCNEHEAQLLKDLMQQHLNILVIGSTGAGKTSVLNALLNTIPEHERVLILEDTPELHRPNKSSFCLRTRMDERGHLPSIDLTNLVKQSLRMRPDRLVVGEVRGSEAKDLLLALSTGHSGSLGTLHASSANQALMRLEMLVQMGAPYWSLEVVKRLIFLSVNVIVVAGKENGHRKLNGIFKLSAYEDSGVLLEPLT